MPLHRPLIAAALLALSLTGCVQEVKRDRVETALIASGIQEPYAGCMARRMAQKLTIAQLNRLQQLGGAHDWQGYINAVRNFHDPDALEVLISSYGLCRSGLIQ